MHQDSAETQKTLAIDSCPTTHADFIETSSPVRLPGQDTLEYELSSPTRAQFNTQRATKIKTSLQMQNRIDMNDAKQNTPETIRRDTKQPAHIRMSSNPHVLQSVQGGQEEGRVKPQNDPGDIVYDPDHPRDLLTSEIDIISRVDQFRSSVTSLQGLLTTDQKFPNSSSAQLKITKEETKFKYPEKAMPLITINNQSNQFEVNPEAVDFLSHIKGPLGIVSVAGMYRTGKSYLLNRVLLNRQGGFGVGPSIHPCTKGIHIWGAPISGMNAAGEAVNVLVVDSEGLGGLDEDNNHDMRIFSLALLISSYFIYNSMGQIDEAAISSLSLVVNLTKHIHTSVLRDRGSDETELESQLEAVLPNFLWVLRDFSLQLEDEEGREITSSEYLENALSQRSRDSNDQKNKIRQALQSFFKTRDCQTMVRPLVNEDRLQSLEELEIESLRPEFIEQVMQLRRKVLHCMPVKRILGHAIDGKTWAGLLMNYVEQMNTGKVPNIESSWHNLCQVRAQQGLTCAIEQFQREIEQAVMPAHASEIEKLVIDAERTAIRDLQRELVGDETLIGEIVAQFKQIIEQKSADIRFQNEASCQEFCQQMLVQLFSELEQVKQSILEDPAQDAFQQVDFALRELSNYYENNCFEFAEKRLYLSEAKTQFMAEILNIQSRLLIDHQRASDDLATQIKESYQTQLRESKDEAREEKEKLEGANKQTLLQKSELESNNQILREQLENVKESKQKDDEESAAAILKLRSQLSGLQDETRTSKEAHEDQLKELQRNIKQSQSEFDKEKALMEQKITYLEQQLKEKQDKERESTTEWRSQKTELSLELKQLTAKYETDVKLLTKQYEEEKEKVSDLELQLNQNSERLEGSESRFTEMETSLRKQLNDAQALIKELQTSQNQQKQENDVLMSSRLKKSETELRSQKSQIEEMEARMKESFEAQMTVTHNAKKDIAMRDQQIEFLTMQLKESKEQLEESQRQHQAMVEALNKNNEASDEETQSQQRLELLQKEFDATNQAQQQKITNLTKANEEMAQKLSDSEHQSRLAQNEALHKLNEAKMLQDDLEHSKTQLNEKIKQLESSKLRLNEDNEASAAKLRQTHEREMAEKDDQLKAEVEEAKEQAQQQLNQTKNFYEMEKTQLEARIAEERDRATRKVQNMQDDIDAKILEACREKDLALEYLQDQLSNFEQHQQSCQAQLEHELNMKQQTCENLERQLNEAKDRLQQWETSKNSTFSKQVEHFETQRIELNSRIDRLTTENLEKDKQIASLTHKLDRNSDTLAKKISDLEQLREQMDKEKSQMAEKMENTRKRLQEVQDEAMQLKLESGREQALLTQQVEFMNCKIQELQKTCDEGQRSYEERLKHVKQEVVEEAQAQMERITSEKELWESKYEQKRRALKEVENTLGRKNGELEKQNNVLKSQILKLEQEKVEAVQQANEEIQCLQSQLASLDNSADQAFQFGSVQAEDLAKIKTQLQETERELQDLQSNYDRDKALWEGKVMFLETQKDNYKRDLNESQRKFEVTLEQLQKRGNQSKEKSENNSNAIIRAMESKYKNQIKEIMETHQALSVESKNKIKRLEQELQGMTEKLNSATQNRYEEVGTLEKRFTEKQQNEEKLAHELEELKNERNRRVTEYQEQIERERETFKNRLCESEKKAKEAEQKRANLIFTVEKERANWVMEEDQLKRKINELEEQQQQFEQSREALKKEIDRLRQELRAAGASNAGPARKPFLFAKPAQGSPGLNSTQNSQGASKYLMNKSSQLQSNISSAGSVSGSFSASGPGQFPMQGNTANNIINAAINRLKESKLQQKKDSSTPTGSTAQNTISSQSNLPSEPNSFGSKTNLTLKQSTSQSSLGVPQAYGAGGASAKRRDMIQSPDTHFSMHSSQGNTFGATRGSQGNIRMPFGQPYNAQAAANMALANVNKRTEGKLVLGLARGGSRGASNGRDRYRNSSNMENFDATSQDNSNM